MAGLLGDWQTVLALGVMGGALTLVLVGVVAFKVSQRIRANDSSHR